MLELASEERIAALEAENARLLAVCQEVCRLLTDSEEHSYGEVYTSAVDGLKGDDSALKAALQAEHSKAIRTFAEAWRKVVPEFVAHLQIEHLMQPLEPPSTAAEKIRAVFDALLENAREEGKQSMLCPRKAHQPYDALECPVCLARERDSLRVQLAEAERKRDEYLVQREDMQTKRERDALAAQVERLRQFVGKVERSTIVGSWRTQGEALLAETPAASLAAVREQARREALEEAIATMVVLVRDLCELAAQPAKEPRS